MPGTPACVRCGTSLRLQAVAIDVHPPRASPLVRQVRRWFAWRRLYYPLRDFVIHRGGALERRAVGVFDAAPLKPGSLPRMLLPGWAQRFQGRTQRGKAFFGVWSALFTAGLMCLGSTFGSVMFGLAFAVHAGSILDLLLPATDRAPRQIVLRGVAVGAALLALYLPLSRVVTHFVDARQWLVDAGPFASGDVVLFNPRAYLGEAPQVGDIVLFRGSDWRVMRGNTVYGGGGEGTDRILAGPGSTVAWKHGELWVDGRRSNLRPLNGQALPDQADLPVPAGMYYIVPSTDPLLGNVVAPLRPDLVLHPQGAMEGRAIVRHYPIWRWWWMN